MLSRAPLTYSEGSGISMPKRSLVFCLLSLLVLTVSGCFPEEEAPPKITGAADYRISRPIPIPKAKPKKYPKITDVPLGWVPSASIENKSRWKGIVIHHSGIPFGSAAHEDKYHKSNGWDGLGYHFVINNGVKKNGYGEADGLVEVGYRWKGQKVGSHCKENGDTSNYWNKYTVGICLVGNFEKSRPTKRQLQSLTKLVRFLQDRYNIPTSQIKGHGQIKPTKCPGRKFPITRFKSTL